MEQTNNLTNGRTYSFSPQREITLTGEASRDSDGRLVLLVPDCLVRRQMLKNEKYNRETMLFYPACSETDIRTTRGPYQFILEKEQEQLIEKRSPFLEGRFSSLKNNEQQAA